VGLIHVTLAELAYRARKAHTISLSSFSSQQPVILIAVYPFTTAYCTSKFQQYTLLIILLNHPLLQQLLAVFSASSHLGINKCATLWRSISMLLMLCRLKHYRWKFNS